MEIQPTDFDISILGFLNDFARESYRLDITLSFLASNNLVKGGVLLALFWLAWFRVQEDPLRRARLGSTLVASIIAIGVARLLAVSLPFRLRPVHSPDLGFLPPFGMQRSVLDGWSAFPSDHAVLFYALATGLFCASRKLGLLALIYTSLIISFPRIYLGLHYPTDIIAGAMLGASLALCLQHRYAVRTIGLPIQNYAARAPTIFYPLFFLLTYQIADMFNGARAFIKVAEILIKG